MAEAKEKAVELTAKRNIPLAMIGRLQGDPKILADKKTKRGGRVEAGTKITVSESAAKRLQALGYANVILVLVLFGALLTAFVPAAAAGAPDVLRSVPAAGLAVDDTTYTTGTVADEGGSYVVYRDTVNFTNGGTGTYFSPALFVGESNQGTAWLRAVCTDVTGTEDVNIYVDVSNDRVNWQPVTNQVIDQVQTVIKIDTLSTIQGVTSHFRTAQWIRLRFVGQSGNPAATSLRWEAYMPKNTGAPAAIARSKIVNN